VVFVAIGPDGRPTAVRPWTPVSEVDRALEEYAVRLAGLRKQMDLEMEARLNASA
jgi:acyl-CoA hydrolase